MIDIDEFKALNDQWGHVTGDEALKVLAKALWSEVREGDFVIRYGGDEFLLFLPDTDEQGARVMIARAEDAFSKLGLELNMDIGISFGIAMLTDEISLASLIRKADSRLYNNKEINTAERRRINNGE